MATLPSFSSYDGESLQLLLEAKHIREHEFDWLEVFFLSSSLLLTFLLETAVSWPTIPVSPSMTYTESNLIKITDYAEHGVCCLFSHKLNLFNRSLFVAICSK